MVTAFEDTLIWGWGILTHTLPFFHRDTADVENTGVGIENPYLNYLLIVFHSELHYKS